MKKLPKVVDLGYTEFRVANKSIIRNDGKVSKGNNTEAEVLAKEFSDHFTLLREAFFTEGDDSPLSLSKGEMLTYCYLREDSCVFLVHIPQLRHFEGDARSSIVDLAWDCANTVLKDKKVSNQIQLALGAKGAMRYESILIGKLDDEGKPMSGINVRESGFESQKLFYPFFVPTNEDQREPEDPGEENAE